MAAFLWGMLKGMWNNTIHESSVYSLFKDYDFTLEDVKQVCALRVIDGATTETPLDIDIAKQKLEPMGFCRKVYTGHCKPNHGSLTILLKNGRKLNFWFSLDGTLMYHPRAASAYGDFYMVATEEKKIVIPIFDLVKV
jgi:hypothetical protein